MSESIGNYIKNARTELKLTTEEFGNLFDLSSSYITQIEKGYKTPSKKKLFQILKYFNVDLAYKGFRMPVETLIKMYATNKKTPIPTLIKEYEEFSGSSVNELSFVENMRRQGYLETNNDSKSQPHEILKKPYYDLNWLLTQDINEVVYSSRYYDNEYNVEWKNDYILSNIDKQKINDYVIRLIKENIINDEFDIIEDFREED